MSTTTRITALESDVASIKGDMAEIKAGIARLLAAPIATTEPAKVERTEAAPEANPQVSATKALSRSEWKRLRMTRTGTVRKAFAGLNREQAFEAGLCPGFHLPTGERREAIQAWKAAQAS